MIKARMVAVAHRAIRPLVAAAFAIALMASTAEAAKPADSCEDAAEIAVLPSPVAPWKGAPLRVLFTAEKPLDGELTLIAPGGVVAARSADRRGGPPYFWIAEVQTPAAGAWQARLTRQNAPAECRTITRDIVVKASAPPRPGTVAGSVWPINATWNRATENLYSAWIETLFDAPLDASVSWPALHEVLRDRARNLLFNHLGLREDQSGLVIRPDCADLPYFLRAYFSFKLGLPFGYTTCTRGSASGPPRCYAWWNITKEDPRLPPGEEALPKTTAAPPKSVPGSDSLFGLFAQKAAAPPPPPPGAPPAKMWKPPARPAGLAPGFAHYLKWSVGDTVHSGSGRTALPDENTDTYPVPLTENALRPGTVYADPYGHLLVIARRVSQTEESAGVFLAVDAQPDGTVARKRFWRGNFLFAQNPVLGGPGFKRFRPIVRDGSRGLRRLTNAEIAKNPQYGDFSLDQGKLSIEQFYDRMDDLMSPQPLDPARAMKEAIISLDEQVRARVTSVENGRKFQNSGKGLASMPDGAAIFETSGAWEDFATPSRDLRLLIAIDVVKGFPDRVVRRPERYAMPEGKRPEEVKAELQNVLATELAERKFTYPRSDGSAWSLTMKDVVDRAKLIEMAYNVNDCVELRWGAADNSDEAATCKRRAPEAQRMKMAEYRRWFQDRSRPPRP